MISETLLMWLGTMALLVAYTGVSRADNDLSAAIAYLFAFLLWLAFTMHSLGYQTFSGGVAIESSAQSLALIGLVGVIVTLVLLVDVSLDAIRDAI